MGVFTRSSKRPAIHVYFEYICWKFAGRLLDRVNTLLLGFQTCTAVVRVSLCVSWAFLVLSTHITYILRQKHDNFKSKPAVKKFRSAFTNLPVFVAGFLTRMHDGPLHDQQHY